MYKTSFWVKLLALVVAFGFLSAGGVMADELYARIRGTVFDSTGATVPDVAITAMNTGTGISKAVATGSDGTFEILDLPIGEYKVTAVKTSFKTHNSTGITLTVNQIFVLTIKLELGEVSEQVVVEAVSSQVETTSMQLGTVVTAQTIVDMPLNGRNWIQLQQLQPGVMSGSDRFGAGNGGTAFSTNGSQAQQNSFLINGTDSNDLPLNTALVIPSPDAIAEFQLVTNTINPEYGRNSGGILNAVIKSGTNSFHGSGFDFYRDTGLNSKGYFQLKPQVFHQNQFGGTIGGPIWKDHTFGFFSYQGTRARQPSGNATGTTTVFTAAQVAGSGFVDPKTGLINNNAANPSPIPLFGDSASPCPVSSGTRCAAGTPYSKLFSTGAIPSADFNALSTTLITKFVPPVNFGTNKFSFQPLQKATVDQYLYRVDHTFNAHDAIWFYAFQQGNPIIANVPFTGATLPGFAEVDVNHVKQYTASENHTFNGSTLNEFRLGYTRLNFNAVAPVTPTLPSSVGFQIDPQLKSGAGLPRMNVSGFFRLGFSSNGPQPRIDQTYQVTDNFSKVIGKHSIKMGFEGRRFEVNNPFSASNSGQFGFTAAGNDFTTGNAGADFLLGFPSTYAQTSGGDVIARAYEYYAYVQDQFKLRPNLTITYGIGYQIDTPLSDLFNKGVAINCFRANQQSKVFPSAPLGLNFPGDKGCSSAGYGTHYDNFGPRVGFAWSPNWGRLTGGPGKFSIRGGYGIYYNRSEEELSLQSVTAPPFSLADAGITDVGGHPSFIAPFTDISCINSANAPIPGCMSSNTLIGVPAAPTSIPNKYPFVPPAPGTSPDFKQFGPLGLNILDPNLRSPQAMNYNLTIQRELPGRMILSVGYVGAIAHHLISETELNHIISPAACVADPVCAKNPANAVELPSQQFNFPFPGTTFASLGQQNSVGNSTYNSLQVSVNKALSHGLTFLAAYTYSHSLDIGSSFEGAGFGGINGPGINYFNPRTNYGDSAFDARQRFVLSYTYNIPSLQHLVHALPSRVADGWRFGGITTFQAGFPIYPIDNGVGSGFCSGNFQFYQCPDVPVQVAPVHLLSPRSSAKNPTNLVFNPASFVPEGIAPKFLLASGILGNTHRGAIHALGLNNFDFQFSKDTKITEKTALELRVELFNMWNHTQFDSQQVSNDISAGTFGQVLGAHAPRIAQLAAKFTF